MRRRELFSSLASSFMKKDGKSEIVLRPPYYENEEIFFSNCIDCNKVCSTVCDENIILIDKDGTPILDLEISGCTYCDECANACPNDVLDINFKKDINAKIEIDVLKCLSWNQTMCFSCKDPCDDNAIEFLAMFRPTILANCTSCGFCISTCPTNAIKIVKE